MTQITSVSLSRTRASRYQFLGKIGKVVSYTSIAVGPDGLGRRAPYLVAIVDFGKERATLPLVNTSADEVQTGMRVVGVLRRMFEPTEDGIITYGTKCTPIKTKK